MTLLASMATMVVAASAAVSHSVVVVNADRDRPLACPANASLAESLQVAIPELTVLAPPQADPNAFEVSLSFGGTSWTLVISRADGSPALTRTLGGAATDCPLVASAATAVVERFLSGVEWTGEPVHVAALKLEPAPRSPPVLRRLVLSAGPTLRAPIGVGVSVGVDLTASARIGARGFAQVGGWMDALGDSLQVAIPDQPVDRSRRARLRSGARAVDASATRAPDHSAREAWLERSSSVEAPPADCTRSDPRRSSRPSWGPRRCSLNPSGTPSRSRWPRAPAFRSSDPR